MKNSKSVFWATYAAFVLAALYFGGHENLFSFSGPLAGVKFAIFLCLAVFLVYSIYCSTRENLFRTVGKIWQLHWGRQIGIDLYLGLVLALFIIYLNGGMVAVALWIIPTLMFANLSILLYFAIYFDEIVAHFPL
jgi:hypothetical protein